MTYVDVWPDAPFIGDAATVSAAIHNRSDIALPLKLKLYLDDKSKLIATGRHRQGCGRRRAGRADCLAHIGARPDFWDPRKVILVASAEGYGDVARDETDVTLQMDAEVVGIRATPEAAAMQGEEVAIEVEVRNNGPAAVNVPVTLRFPSGYQEPRNTQSDRALRRNGKRQFRMADQRLRHRRSHADGNRTGSAQRQQWR